MPIAESWDGTNWTAQTISSAPGATYSNLFGVSCTSATACTAVGYYANSTANWLPLVERWDGTTWAVQTAANPAGSGYSVLHAVSCTSTTTCSAVGSANSTKSASTGTSLAESWDGTGWTVQPTPSPTGATAGNLNGVSCTSTIACTAVGYYADASGTWLTLPESWNGTNWTVQVGANPKAVSGAILNALACTSANVCNAVGTLTTKTGISSTLAERHT
jgi:hypothetical protein